MILFPMLLVLLIVAAFARTWDQWVGELALAVPGQVRAGRLALPPTAVRWGRWRVDSAVRG